MRKWLYVISENGGRELILKKGEPVVVSADNFKRHVLRENLSEEDPWYININYREVKRGDEVFIYHTGKKIRKGIIGYAKVNNVDQTKKAIYLTFNIRKCRSLLKQPIPPEYVIEHWYKFPQNILSLDRFSEELDSRFRGQERKSLTPETEEIRKELDLKPFRKIVVTSGKNDIERKLIHDRVLKPVVNILQDKRFDVYTRNFGKLRIDLIGVRDNLVVIVEGKTNKPGEGREEARQAFGQLYEYLWYFKNSMSKKRQSHLWIAFQNKPHRSVISFLEDHSFIISYMKNGKVKFPKEPEKIFQ